MHAKSSVKGDVKSAIVLVLTPDRLISCYSPVRKPSLQAHIGREGTSVIFKGGIMLVNTFYSSASDLCGITIFNRHLREALSRVGLGVLETNLLTATRVIRTPIEILHYVPSCFASSEASDALVQFLVSVTKSQKLFIILHGLHSYGEDRFRDDTICPQGEQHIRLMLQTAESITALSHSAARACGAWQTKFRGNARLLRLDHPGLFARNVTISPTRDSYAFVGGISRSKKVHAHSSLLGLLDLCRRQGVRVWEHWTNVPPLPRCHTAWKRTFGFVSDLDWSKLVSNAHIVLFPYQTRIQSVSGLMSEALSAQRFVLSTSFDLALEMKKKYPSLVSIEDDLGRWPHIIRHLPRTNKYLNTVVPTWNLFANSLALELAAKTTELTGSAAQFQPVPKRGDLYQSPLGALGRRSMGVY